MTSTTNTFPSDFASNSEKHSKDYGKKVGEAMEAIWLSGNKLNTRRIWIDEMRAYSRGEQQTDYKSILEGTRKDQEGPDIKTHKIDYSPLKVLPTMKDIVINAIDESLFKPRAEAIDITSINEKKQYFKKLDKNYYTKEVSDLISKNIGINITPKDIPDTEEELEIKKLEFKPDIEIAKELAIESVMKKEKHETIKDKIDEDLFDLGFGVARHYTDSNEGIKFKYVDPYNYIHNDFEYDDGRDIRFHGVLEKVTIGQLSKEAGGLDAEDLLAIKNLAIGEPSNKVAYSEEEDGHRLAESISFAYLVEKKRIYKKRRINKSTKIIDRTNDEEEYSPNNPSKKISIPYKVWYEGIYVPEARVIIKWQPIENQIEKGINEPISPFLVYAPKIKRLSEKGPVRFDSMVQRAKPMVDDLHRDYFKVQQLKMELRPATTEIDTDALKNVTLNGDKINPKHLIDLYFGRGLLLKRAVNDDGDPIPNAITEQNGGINNSAIPFLINEFANHYNRLRTLLGINELRDGTANPNTKTSVAVSKILYASSNNQTSHLVKASFKLSLAFAESISYRLIDVLKMPSLRQKYLNIIGTDNVELLDTIKRIPMSRFGIYFDFKPDDEERVNFERSLVDSYNNKEINVAQYNKARQVRNVKSAVRYLEYIIDKNIKEEQARKLENIEKQSEANTRNSIIVEQTKQQTETIKFETEKNLMQEKYLLEDKSLQRKALIDDAAAERQHQRAMELKQLEVYGMLEKAKQLEEGKKERVNLASTNNSLTIEQKQNKTGPINFKDQIEDILSEPTLPKTQQN